MRIEPRFCGQPFLKKAEISVNEPKSHNDTALSGVLYEGCSFDGVVMPSVNERNGRFTAQIRLRGFPTRAKTFDTHKDAFQWGQATENAMMLAAAAEPEPEISVDRAYESCGVYFLFKKAECVYVGQSLNVHRRIQDHRRRIDFDVYSWTPVPPAQLVVIEQMYINALRPINNHIYVVEPRRRAAL